MNLEQELMEMSKACNDHNGFEGFDQAALLMKQDIMGRYALPERDFNQMYKDVTGYEIPNYLKRQAI